MFDVRTGCVTTVTIGPAQVALQAVMMMMMMIWNVLGIKHARCSLWSMWYESVELSPMDSVIFYLMSDLTSYVVAYTGAFDLLARLYNPLPSLVNRFFSVDGDACSDAAHKCLMRGAADGPLSCPKNPGYALHDAVAVPVRKSRRFPLLRHALNWPRSRVSGGEGGLVNEATVLATPPPTTGSGLSLAASHPPDRDRGKDPPGLLDASPSPVLHDLHKPS